MVTQLQEIQATQPIIENQKNRLQIVDILRGFSLLGILLIHSLQQFLSTTSTASRDLNGTDNLIEFLVDFLIQDKFFTIFSFLFGWSFFVIYKSAIRKRQPFVRIFTWRLTVLLGIGIFHSLFFKADILQVYAVTGLVLILCRNFRSKSLLLLSIGLFLCSILSVIFSDKSDIVINALKDAGILIPSKLRFNIVTGRLFTTLSMFLLGFYIGKVNLLNEVSARFQLFKKVALCSGYIFLFTIVGYVLSHNSTNPQVPESVRIFQITITALQNLSLSCLYVSVVILLYNRMSNHKLMAWLIPLGKMGLSGYLMQSVFLYFFYHSEEVLEMSLSMAMAITLLFYITQVIFAGIWFSSFKSGPAEWVWRSLTNLAVPGDTTQPRYPEKHFRRFRNVRNCDQYP
ncbi:DUF418 domain-containing protein [Dyadobacter sp. NIV53]|uniref:DUF418 domain-containing protein n=1 Tax=Dyadobacter sp. NIV53 TaxID=2861765 RepID=UPI001C87132B|nr:DUF418 domain-containing protein [Dyadobacter sp. NIV53]